MGTRQFHMPHLHLPRRGEPHEAEHHEARTAQRFRKIEGGIEYLTVAGLIVLMLAMAYGLLTTSGQSIW
jgi:hypothetical protein